ncbi:hypothetical protein L228DRAFT_259735 [Xylona heveae TC161]|uniref:Tho complex subunit 7 n=1 Tax=Xylona heveae (strain CBS 132557 / TC161) TaxID=1328760 RepID=A0A165I8B5_XYLHT|nr:hypothetical protein L228DRAFT_259735 [Xylona heveae TC161]KZF24530.1 hypothetical protein L228DRAFT_259735 [Xylona heveae TC161]
MSDYSLLDQADEDGLHKSRLLNVEEKPYKRITKRLLTPNSLIYNPPKFPLTPPPDASAADEAAASQEREKQNQLEERRQWREDVLLDFTAFESSIIRTQFLLTSNAQERERYAKEKLKILATAQAVKENTAELRQQLEEAQKTLALRKTYDDLTEKITSNRMLRPREDQHANIAKLNAEIAELERESREYAQTWAERREQFGRIIEEGMQLRRMIRDEKEEAERREGMEDQEEGEEGEVGAQKGEGSSAVGTPKPDAEGLTPLPQDGEGLTPAALIMDKHSPPGQAPLRGSSRAPSTDRDRDAQMQESQETEDVSMADQGQTTGGTATPQIQITENGAPATPAPSGTLPNGAPDKQTNVQGNSGDRMDMT